MASFKPTKRTSKTAKGMRDNRQVVNSQPLLMPAMRAASQRESYLIARGLFIASIAIIVAVVLIGCMSGAWHMGYEAASQLEVSAHV